MKDKENQSCITTSGKVDNLLQLIAVICFTHLYCCVLVCVKSPDSFNHQTVMPPLKFPLHQMQDAEKPISIPAEDPVSNSIPL